MFEFKVDGKTKKAEVSFHTALLYEMEFGGNIISDLFGKQVLEAPPEDGTVVIDFTNTNWSAVMKVLWAAMKTADENTPTYSAWMKSARGINLWEVSEVLSVEVADCFFRSEDTEENA